MINERKDPVYEVYDDTEELTYKENHLVGLDASFHHLETNQELQGDELSHTYPESHHSDHSDRADSIESAVLPITMSEVEQPELKKGISEESVSIIEKPEPTFGNTIGLKLVDLGLGD
jgi:hypothetical protein